MGNHECSIVKYIWVRSCQSGGSVDQADPIAGSCEPSNVCVVVAATAAADVGDMNCGMSGGGSGGVSGLSEWSGFDNDHPWPGITAESTI
jgi:hypothetical protein